MKNRIEQYRIAFSRRRAGLLLALGYALGDWSGEQVCRIRGCRTWTLLAHNRETGEAHYHCPRCGALRVSQEERRNAV